jgi:hypothetical protein
MAIEKSEKDLDFSTFFSFLIYSIFGYIYSQQKKQAA